MLAPMLGFVKLGWNGVVSFFISLTVFAFVVSMSLLDLVACFKSLPHTVETAVQMGQCGFYLVLLGCKILQLLFGHLV